MIAGLVGRGADIATIAALLALLVLGGRMSQTAILHLRHRRAGVARERLALAQPLPPDAELPEILVQIPAYNEGVLVERAVAAAVALDWPRDRLQIQLIDQSTGESAEIARATAAKFRERGHDVVLIWRPDRTGFKAGSLKAGLDVTGQPFIANFDVDYVPDPDFLRRCMRPLLADATLAFVQARCDFLNARQNLVTLAQQVILESHSAGEQATRSWAGQFLPYNGTCGIWRRAAIVDAGGWQFDTLAEDLDLSLRAQVKGWRAMFLLSIAVPGELPATLASWGRQQSRWNKGFAQTARKLLPAVWRSKLRLSRKFGISLHLAECTHGPLELLVGTAGIVDWLLGTMTYAVVAPLLLLSMLQGAADAVVLSAVSAALLQHPGARGGGKTRFALTVYTMLMHMQVGVLTARAVVEGVLGRASSFERTPKHAAGLRSEN
jgi:cellulose synthase/poly-beta-1,6-N-acetylglucosamine synthase-like glycosyltransferase